MDNNMLMTALKMGVALGAVLLCFGLSVWLFRRFSSGSKSWLKGAKSDAAKPLEILSYRNLGPSRALYLVRCLDKKYFIGATQQNIALLGEVEDAEEQADKAIFQTALRGEMPAARKQEFQSSLKDSLKEISRV